MTATLELPDGTTRKACPPFHDADHAVVPGACPLCNHSPFRVAGVRCTLTRGHDTYTSTGVCLACGEAVGQLVAHVSTIFGIEEDERVLLGSRCRVY